MIIRRVSATIALVLVLATGGATATTPKRMTVDPSSTRRFTLKSANTSARVAAPIGHPRLWLTAQDLPRLQSWAANSNPLYRDGLAVLAARARADMDAGRVPNGDAGGDTYEQYPSEMYAELFAFMSLLSPNGGTRDDYARRSRSCLMRVINAAVKGASSGQPFRDPAFSTSDRSRWWGEGFPLTVDWIYPYLSSADKRAIRTVFLRWVDEDVHAATTNDNHPEPIGLVNNPALVKDPVRVRYAANNYYMAHMRNIGLMALALDPADDPGGALHRYLGNATGAWLYVVDYLLRHDARGGLAPEGFEYSPHSLGYTAQFLLALQTAGQDSAATWGPQVVLSSNPFWTDLVPAYLHSVSPAPAPHPYLGLVYQPAWYGDGQNYWAADPMEMFGPLGVYDYDTGRTRQLQALRWIETNIAPGGSARLVDRVRGADTFRDAILSFLLFDPRAPAPADPRPSLPLTFYAPGIGRLLARTSWDAGATSFDYSLGWISIDHQHGDGDSFEFYRRGEWLTKERTGYGFDIGSSDYHNTLALQNSAPFHNASDDYRHMLWQRGSQWTFGNASSDGRILAHSFGRGFVYALGDATGLYNSAYEGATDITHASRSIVWLEPDEIIIYDRAGSRTAGRFKRFWLQLPAPATVVGHLATVTTPRGQHLYLTSLLPGNAAISSAPDEPLNGEPANQEPMRDRLRIEAPGGPRDVRFLNILQGADPGHRPASATLVQSVGGTPFAGAQVQGAVVLFPVSLGVRFAGVIYRAATGTRMHIITGLAPNGRYDVAMRAVGGTVQVTIGRGARYRADSGGVLTLGAETTPGRVPAVGSSAPSPSPTARRVLRTPTPTITPGPSATRIASGVPQGGGVITYRLTRGHVYRIAAQAGALPQDISLALNRLARGSTDDWLNTSANGAWLVLSTDRFDRTCVGWTCLARVKGDLSAYEVVRINGQVIHPPQIGAVVSAGNLIVYPLEGGPHKLDLWAVTRSSGTWHGPILLTARSPYTYNNEPALSADGRTVVFRCANQPYEAEGSALCRVAAMGGDFSVLLTPRNSPSGLRRIHSGLLEQPAYAPDGSIVFEADWTGEQIWRLPYGATVPVRVGTMYDNDNAPCALPDGRIASLWFDRPGSSGVGEIKVMSSDGRGYVMALTGKDVADIGLGCGR